MAQQTLTSHSFLHFTTTTHRFRRTLNRPRLAVLPKKAGPLATFQRNDDPEDNQANDSTKSNPFRLDFGKLPDVKSLIPIARSPSSGLAFGSPRRKDPGTVFVAGATGQVGVRIAQTLLRKGFSVRAGVPDLAAAQDLARLAATYKIISNEESKRLNAVESTFQDAESIAKAIGNATKVVVTIGGAENGPGSLVSTSDALLVVQAAQLAGVSHVVVIYDGNLAGASTYNVLDGITSFFNNLFSQSQPLTIPEFLEKVIETDVAYTLIKTGLTEDFSPENSYNLTVSAEGRASPDVYKVAKSKIASVVADVFSNTAVAENKVVEVFTDPMAPLRPVDELFSVIPEDGRRKDYAEALAKAKAEEEARIAAEKAREAAEAAKRLEEEVKKLSEQEAVAANLAEEAKEKAEAAGVTMDSLLSKAKGLGSGLSWGNFNSQVAAVVQKATEKPKVQIATVRGQAKARTLPARKAVVKQMKPESFTLRQKQEVKVKEEKPEPSALKQKEEVKAKGQKAPLKTEVRKVFGGLFQQETIYVDDD